MKFVPPKGKEHLGDTAEYVDADIISGIEGSIVPAAAINQLLREMLNAIKLSGIIPSDEDLTQLHQAMVNISVAWSQEINYINQVIVMSAGKMYTLIKPSGPAVLDTDDISIVGYKRPEDHPEYWKEFSTFKKSDVKYLEDELSTISSIVESMSTEIVRLNDLHTVTGLASESTAGHVIPGKTLTIDNSTGTIDVNIDNQTIKKSANNVLYAEVPSELTAVSPIRVSNSAINIDIDNNTLILSNNKLSVNPAIINNDDAEKTTINSVLLNELNTLRKLSIGRPVFHTSTTLPDDHVWIDGSFISFEDRPEFASRYLDGAFNGMLLEWNATEEDIDKNPGKFRKNAANPTGLYLPSDGNQFYRHWNASVSGTSNPGGHNSAGLPNATGGINAVATLATTTNKTGVFSSSDVPGTYGYTGGAVYRNYADVNFSLASANTIYGNSTTVMPESTNIPVIMYLGKTEALNEVFYNNGTQQLPIASGMDLGVMKVDNKQFTVDKFGTLHLNGYVPTTTDLTKEILTADGTYTVPHSGWYKIICIGGGGAGGSNSGMNVPTAGYVGYGGNQGGSTIFGTYISAIGGSGGGGCSHGFYGSGGGGCGEIVEQYLFLTRGEEIPYTIGTGALPNTTTSQQGQGSTGGKTKVDAYNHIGTGAIGAGYGFASSIFSTNQENGGPGGNGAISIYGYGAGGGGAGGNGNGIPDVSIGGQPGSILAKAGDSGTNAVGNKRSGGAGALGAIIIETMSILQGSIDVSSTPTQETIVSNSVYTPETSSWYEITIIGGGGGGGCDPGNITSAISGGGGGQGEHKTIYKKLSPTKPLTISIGRGGVGSTLDTEAEDGFTTTVDIGGEIISAEGGKKGTRYIGGQGGGTGISSGLPGHNGNVNTYGDGNTIVNTVGGMGGGSNAGYVTYTITESGETISKINATGYGSGGGGGWGGNSSNPLRSGGSNGCHGAVIIKKLISGGGSGTAVDVNIATTQEAGIVKPDGKSILVDTDGTIKAKEIVTLESYSPYKTYITTNSSWTCPKSGWYEIVAIGGGGGGAGGTGVDNYANSGASGSTGGRATINKYIKIGEVFNISIGVGGIGGIKNTGNIFTRGSNGSPTTISTTGFTLSGCGGAAGGGISTDPWSSGSVVSTANMWDTLPPKMETESRTIIPGTSGIRNSLSSKGYVDADPGTQPSYPDIGAGYGGRGSSGISTDGAANRTAGNNGGSGIVMITYVAPASSGMESELLNEFNKLRKTSIGRLVYHTSTILPDTDHVWADGKTFVKFSERPEFKQKFDNGGFDSMLMAWDADATTIEANRGKYRPDAEVPTGLWVPNVTNLFVDNWTPDSAYIAGSRNEAGLPNITGVFAKCSPYSHPSSGAFNTTSSEPWGDVSSAKNVAVDYVNMNASRSNPIYGNSTEVMPNSANIPMMIYLGRTTGDDVLYYNPETTGLIKAATPSDKGVVTVDNKTIAVDDNGQLFSRIIPPLLLGLEWTHSVSEDGYLNLSVDNGLLIRSDYKEGWDKISKLDPSMVLDDTAWLAEKTAKGWVNKYSSGDGNLTFRVPLWSKEYIATMTPGSVKQVGDTVIDEMRPITGSITKPAGGYGGLMYTLVAYPLVSAGALSTSYSGTKHSILIGDSGTREFIDTIDLNTNNLGANYSGDVTHGPGAILYPHLRIKNYVDDRASIDPGNEVYVRHDHALLDTFFNPLTIMPGCLDMSIDHGLLSRATYANAWDKISKQAGTNLITDEAWLAEVAANGVCAKFSSGDGVRTFRVPYIKKMYIRAPDAVSKSGDHLIDTMRPITGNSSKHYSYAANNTFSGALKSESGGGGVTVGSSASTGCSSIVLDSAQLGAHYAGTDTHPESVVWIPWIKMFGSIANPESIAIESIVDDRVKLNSSFGMPSETYEDITTTAALSVYTAKSDGWVSVVAITTGSNGWISLENTTTGLSSHSTYPLNTGTLYANIQVSTGAKIRLNYGTVTVSRYRFIPAIKNNPTTAVPIVDEVPHYPLGRLLEKKVDVNGSYGMPSNEYIDISGILNANGAKYTAPSDGIVYVEYQSTGTSLTWVRLTTPSISDFGYGLTNAQAIRSVVTVSKDTQVILNLANVNQRLLLARFIPIIKHNPSEPLELEPEATSDYSTSETYTGSRWIDGKKIYRRVMKCTVNSSGGASTTWTPVATNNVSLEELSNIDKIISTKTIWTNDTQYQYLNFNYDIVAGVLRIHAPYALPASRPFDAILEYVKK